MTIRVGIISANWGAFAHLPAWRSIDGVEVVAICTSREPLTWTPPVCQVNNFVKDRLRSYIRPIVGSYTWPLWSLPAGPNLIIGIGCQEIPRV